MSKTVTFETEHGPKTYTLDELQIDLEGDGRIWVSRNTERWHATEYTREEFVRKLFHALCVKPQDETVGEIREALRLADNGRYYVRIFADTGADIHDVHANDEATHLLEGDNKSILSAIRSLTEPEPTKDEVFGEMLKHLRQIRTNHQHYGLSIDGELIPLIARAEKLQEDGKCSK